MPNTRESQPPPDYKIVVLGESAVGKTSLVHRFTSDSFEAHTTNTIGAAYITKIYSSRQRPEHHFKLEIWDTAGQERYRSLTPMYYRNAKTALVCFDLANFASTFTTAKYWIQQLELNNSSTSDKVDIRLIGTKADLVKDESVMQSVSRQVQELVESEESVVSFHETSSKSNVGIVELFDDIVDGISDSFIESYYNQLNSPRENVGLMLGSRNNASSCC
ncbi:uncharacterized protein LODBEIA_P26680 [Lodderomyces beijingensis]|uniref:Uncharacterized protein n=1 Tax=Lodderomyces beijingensis TaxID=1775926 RepID=A0ABP0ZJW5_9ASCO